MSLEAGAEILPGGIERPRQQHRGGIESLLVRAREKRGNPAGRDSITCPGKAQPIRPDNCRSEPETRRAPLRPNIVDPSPRRLWIVNDSGPQ